MPVMVVVVVLLGVVALAFRDGEYGIPALIGTAVAIATGPLMYRLALARGSQASREK